MDKLESSEKQVFLIDTPFNCFAIKAFVNDKFKQVNVCGNAQEFSHADGKISKMSKLPDLVITDLVVNGKLGLEWIKQVKLLHPTLQVLVFTQESENQFAVRVVKAGGRGFVSKNEKFEDIVKAFEKALRTETEPVISEKVTSTIINQVALGHRSPNIKIPLESLSDREMEVLRMLGIGKDTRTIAKELFISIKTVEAHRANIKKKLSLKDSFELNQYAINHVKGGS